MSIYKKYHLQQFMAQSIIETVLATLKSTSVNTPELTRLTDNDINAPVIPGSQRYKDQLNRTLNEMNFNLLIDNELIFYMIIQYLIQLANDIKRFKAESENDFDIDNIEHDRMRKFFISITSLDNEKLQEIIIIKAIPLLEEYLQQLNKKIDSLMYQLVDGEDKIKLLKQELQEPVEKNNTLIMNINNDVECIFKDVFLNKKEFIEYHDGLEYRMIAINSDELKKVAKDVLYENIHNHNVSCQKINEILFHRLNSHIGRCLATDMLVNSASKIEFAKKASIINNFSRLFARKKVNELTTHALYSGVASKRVDIVNNLSMIDAITLELNICENARHHLQVEIEKTIAGRDLASQSLLALKSNKLATSEKIDILKGLFPDISDRIMKGQNIINDESRHEKVGVSPDPSISKGPRRRM